MVDILVKFCNTVWRIRQGTIVGVPRHIVLEKEDPVAPILQFPDQTSICGRVAVAPRRGYRQPNYDDVQRVCHCVLPIAAAGTRTLFFIFASSSFSSCTALCA